ncbi:integrase/recombinase [Halodesulfurarchaeum formicicum]|uniref:Integrase/recombinase n=1 Tax=Halodesulfurarchaeum formicicum TaxID=1873524 RepID=A0A1D8S678_9EURY|nr:integrase/recombinase [Halodesulfurarchaeum formicicum]
MAELPIQGLLARLEHALVAVLPLGLERLERVGRFPVVECNLRLVSTRLLL